MKIAVICIWIGCLFPLVSSGQSEWVIRRDALKVTPLTEIAIEEKWDTIYRLWDIPASEHLRRAPIIVFTLKYRGPISHEEYEGVVSIRVGLPDGTVLSRSQEASSKSIMRIGKVFYLTEALSLPERERDGWQAHPYESMVLHAGGYDIEGYNRETQDYRKISRSAEEGSVTDQIQKAYRRECAELIKELSAEIEAWERKSESGPRD